MHSITLDSSWLTNGELFICLLKNPPPKENEYSNDLSRPHNIALLESLLEKKTQDASFLSLVSQENPVLVLGSELAFSSNDYEKVREELLSFEGRLVLISGFGFCTGTALKALSKQPEVESSFEVNSLLDSSIFNCGWVWIKDQSRSIRCILFIKTFVDQTHETPLNVVPGKDLLRINTNDLIIFPLICSELICNLEQNPRKQILESLDTDSPTTSQKVLVTLSSYEMFPSKNFWSAGIGNLLNNGHGIRLLISNCFQPPPQEEESKDKWRCLTGGYLKIGSMKAPDPVLPYIRYVEESQCQGLVLRSSNFGAAAGKIAWTTDPSTNKYVLTINYRWDWEDVKLIIQETSANSEELFRLLKRYKEKVIKLGNYVGKPIVDLLDQQIDVLKQHIRPLPAQSKDKLTKKLLKLTLHGVESANISCDSLMPDQCTDITRAFFSLLAIKKSMEYGFPEEIEMGQIVSSDLQKEILVWKSGTIMATQILLKLEQLASESGSGKALVVIGAGNGQGSIPPNQKVFSKRLTDYTASKNMSGATQSITDTRDRTIYWQSLGDYEDLYSKTDSLEKLQKVISDKIAEAV